MLLVRVLALAEVLPEP